jgi:AraC-like DNA-binding protein
MSEDAHPAGQRLSFRTGDLDRARDHVARTFADHEMRVGDSRDFDLRLRLAPSLRMTLGKMSYGTSVRNVAPPMRFCYHVNLPIAGQSAVEQNGARRVAMAGVAGAAFMPDGPLALDWGPETIQYTLKFPKELLEAHAAKLAGYPPGGPIRFDLSFDLSSAPGQALVATAGFLYAELVRPGGMAGIPAACHEMEAALMTQLLMVVPSQLSRALHSAPAHTRRSRIREVMEFIDEHPEAENTTADLAALAGVSARTLQAGFRDVVGMSPTAYLRGVRLDRVHLDLISGVSGSVTGAAARWGFFHPGRFARQYRDRFGVLPSETAQAG